jgi:hypothetical protein
MARRPDTTLDRILVNVEKSLLALSKIIAAKAKDLDKDDLNFLQFTQAIEKLVRAVSQLIEAVPFLQTRQQIEVTEAIKAAILESHEIIGEKRQHTLEALTWYEEKVLAKTGHYVPKTTQQTTIFPKL